MKFPMTTVAPMNPEHGDLCCDVGRALAAFHAEFHLHVRRISPAEIREMTEAYADIVANVQQNVHLSSTQWVCLLGMHFLIKPQPDERPRW